jgi:acetyl-CoA synthetase
MAADDRVRELLDAFAVPGATAARLLCERHPADGIALTVIATDLNFKDVTYGELRENSARFAAALSSLGVHPGDHVATLMGHSAELVVALLGIWRLGAVVVPLSASLTREDVAVQLQIGGARLAICDAEQRRKLVPQGEVPNDASALVVVARGEAFGYDASFAEMVEGRGQFAENAGDDAGPVAVGGDGTLMQLFTSGTNGPARGVPVSLRALASLAAERHIALDVRPDDTLWAVAGPGAASGGYLALLAPLAMGNRALLLPAAFSPELAWAVLDTFQVTNFAATPALYAALRTASAEGARHPLRRASSDGAPLSPDMIAWGLAAFGVEIQAGSGPTTLGPMAGPSAGPAATTNNLTTRTRI